ncbi:hypothetical protein EMIT0324P_11094 [Pseudomonas chlororaphis]
MNGRKSPITPDVPSFPRTVPSAFTSSARAIELVQRYQLNNSHHHAECNKASREDPARLFVRLEISETAEKVG